MNILVKHKMDTFLVPYPSIPFSSLYPYSDLKVTAPLCIPPFVHSNNRPTPHWGIDHHQAEGFGRRAPQHGVGIDAADYWSLGRFQGLGKLCAWFCRRLSDVNMRLQTSLSRRRSAITVHPQSTVCVQVRGVATNATALYASGEVTKVEQLVPRVLRSRGIRVSTCSTCSLPLVLWAPIHHPFLPQYPHSPLAVIARARSEKLHTVSFYAAGTLILIVD